MSLSIQELITHLEQAESRVERIKAQLEKANAQADQDGKYSHVEWPTRVQQTIDAAANRAEEGSLEVKLDEDGDSVRISFSMSMV